MALRSVFPAEEPAPSIETSVIHTPSLLSITPELFMPSPDTVAAIPQGQNTTSLPPSSDSSSVVVVGAGVVGAACAYYLTLAGAKVILIDRGEFGRGCSHGNCGFVSPSHVLPLCRPGAVTSSLKTLFQKNSPFKIRPRLDLKTWSWFVRFALKCNQADMIAAGRARHAMLMSSRSLYQELIDSGVLHDCEWEAIGLMFVHHDPHHFEAYEKTNKLMIDEYGLGARRIEADELLQMEPALKPVVAGAWLYECDAHLRPQKLMRVWKDVLLRMGVEIREHCEFHDLETSGTQVRAIDTSMGRIETDQVIFATGAWARMMEKRLRTRIPIEPGKGYSITMKRPTLCPKYPMIFEDHRVAITPTQDAYRIGSTMEFAGYDTTLRRDRLTLLTETAKFYLHEPLTDVVEEEWYGWRPMSADGVPLVGRVPRFRNVWMAAGHSMLGLSMATATGKLIAEMVTGNDPHLDPNPYRLDRF